MNKFRGTPFNPLTIAYIAIFLTIVYFVLNTDFMELNLLNYLFLILILIPLAVGIMLPLKSKLIITESKVALETILGKKAINLKSILKISDERFNGGWGGGAPIELISFPQITIESKEETIVIKKTDFYTSYKKIKEVLESRTKLKIERNYE